MNLLQSLKKGPLELILKTFYMKVNGEYQEQVTDSSHCFSFRPEDGVPQVL